VGLHSFWLIDWLNYWWIRCPLQGEAPTLAHATFHTLWTAPLWGDYIDRVLAAVLFMLAVIGLGAFHETNRRPAARLFGAGAIGFSVLALAGAACEPLARLGTARLLVVALWCAAIPAAYALMQIGGLLVRMSGSRLRAGGIIVGGLGILCACVTPSLGRVFARYTAVAPLLIGLTPEQLGWVRAIQENTTPQARILWEEAAEDEPGSGWAALLPLLTDRSYIGGLDPAASIEYNYARLGGHWLAGRPLDSWNEPELRDFYRRYNVGWVVCRSPSARASLQDYDDGQPILFVEGKDPRYLYQLAPRSYVLRGQGRLIEADGRHIAFADVAPAEDGTVLISMHYHPGMRVSPSRVQIEPESDPRDPIDFIRLRLQGPVARVNITWPGK
jgi:hypothetical protein